MYAGMFICGGVLMCVRFVVDSSHIYGEFDDDDGLMDTQYTIYIYMLAWTRYYTGTSNLNHRALFNSIGKTYYRLYESCLYAYMR